MRLTLRTLLAYLDDRLPPANARELGQKIANSPFATDLVDRIKEVKRKRRLVTPGKPQPMIEANLIAEYLDDQLTPEVVAQIEREVLASDAMLAEVAASHEVLGMLRDPVKVDPRLRDRLYGLDPTGKTEIVQALGNEPRAAVGRNDAATQWKPPRTQDATSSRRLPAIVIVSLGLIWLAVLAFDSDLFGNKNAANNAANNAVAEVATEVAAAGDEDAASEEVKNENVPEKQDPPKPERKGDIVGQKEVANADIESSLPANNSQPAGKNEPIASGVPAVAKADAPSPNDPPEGEPDSPAGAVGKNDPGKMIASDVPGAEASTDATTTPATTEPVLSASDIEPPPSYSFESDGRVVLVYKEKSGRWFSLSQIPGGIDVTPTRNSVNCFPLIDGSWFGIPESWPLSIVAERKGWTTQVRGPGLMKLASAPSGGLEMFHGRLKLSADRLVAWDDKNLPEFVLTTGTLSTTLKLQSRETVVAIEVNPIAPATDDTAAVAPIGSTIPIVTPDGDLNVQVAVLEGSVQLQIPGAESETMVTKNQRASWKVLDRATLSSLAVQNIESLLTAPEWYFEANSEELPEVVKIKNRLLESLSGDQEPGDAALPMLDDRNAQSGVMAVKLISLTRDIDRLISILYDPRDELIHRAVIDGLSSIANSSMIARQAIRANLETRLSMPEIEPTMMLILGISEAQGADSRVTTDLLLLLGNDRLATRTLAIYRMEQVTGDRMGFHPESEPSRRRDAIRRWQRHIDRNAGKLLP